MTGTLGFESELAGIEQVAVDLASQAGALLQQMYAGPLDVRFKSKRGKDPVTVADEAVETMIREAVAARFPGHGFLGEEGGGRGSTAGYLWVVDPLDGTANFANGLPLFASSIGVLRDGVPVVAALFSMFGPGGGPCVLHARRGGGLRVDGVVYQLVRRELSGRSRLSGVPAGFHRGFRYRMFVGVPPGETRSFGSIAAELGLVATGLLQYALFSGPKIWDVAAGVLLVQEAGGHVWTDERSRWRPLERFVAAPDRDLKDWKQAIAAGDSAVLGPQIPRLHVLHPPMEMLERRLGASRTESLRRSVRLLGPAWRGVGRAARGIAAVMKRRTR